MGPSTPWKSSSQFLDPPGSQCNPIPGIVPPDKGVEPNVIRGLGSINSGIWGEDCLSDNGRTSAYSRHQTGLLPITRPTRATTDPKDRQATSPVGDAPPSNINNHPPPASNYYEGNFLTGGGNPSGRGNPFPGGGGGHPGGGGGNPPGGGGNPFPGGGGRHFGAGGNPPEGGNSPGGDSNPSLRGGHFPHGFPFPSGPPPGGGGDGPPGAGGGILNAAGSSHGDEWDLLEYIPYGTNVPTIKAELKHENLPSWDGKYETAIEYFWKVQQLASLGGWIPQALGYWLWNSLKPGSKVQVWFSTLTGIEQAKMQSHYIYYLKGIKEMFLGKKWQIKMTVFFEGQAFRQPGHKREAPSTFIARRIMYTRMLVAVEEGSPVEVFIIMQKAPISWGPIIVLETIRNTSMLYSRVTEHEAALIQASKQESLNVLTAENVVPILRRMGYYLDRQKGTIDRRAHISTTTQGDSIVLPERQAYISQLDDSNPDLTSPSEILKEVYQASGVRQRPPPKGGYPYPKNDHVVTKMGRMPPSPCKTCGSKNHWDKECPDWAIAQTKRERSGMSVEAEDEITEQEIMYQSAFSVLVSKRIASEQVDLTKFNQSDFELAALLSLSKEDLGVDRKAVGRKMGILTPKVTMVEIEDESWAELRKLPKSPVHILEEISDKIPNLRQEAPSISEIKRQKPTVEEVEDKFWEEYYKIPKSSEYILEDGFHKVDTKFKESHFSHSGIPIPRDFSTNSDDPPTENLAHHLPPLRPPPTDQDKPIRLPKRRVQPDGTSAIGVSVLAVKG